MNTSPMWFLPASVATDNTAAKIAANIAINNNSHTTTTTITTATITTTTTFFFFGKKADSEE